MVSTLTAVSYRLFEGEASAIAAARRAETHDFGGELVLTFEDGTQHFVSWVSKPVQYSVGIKDASHFVPDANLSEFDVSASQMWAGLIGRALSFRFVATNHQALRISSDDNEVWVCSFERGGWCADALTVGKQLPVSAGTPPSFADVADFVRRFTGLGSATDITPATRLDADLGVTGLDGDHLLEQAQHHFTSRLSGPDGYITTFGLAPHEYLFHSEGLDLLGLGALTDRLLGRPKPVVRDLTVGELHDAICRQRFATASTDGVA